MENAFTETETLDNLPEGKRARVLAFHDMPLSLRFMQLGFMPGTEFCLYGKAPLGCPICISLEGDYHLSLRRSEAKTIEIEIL